MRSFAYILAPSYSGSTLLTLLLARHPGLATVGELKATSMGNIDEYMCSCGSRIRNCEFWAKLGDHLAQQGISFDLGDFETTYRAPQRPIVDRWLRARYQGELSEAVRMLALSLTPSGRRTLTRVTRRNVAIASAVCEIEGAEVFLDGSKEPVRLRHLLRAGLPDPRVIHIVRDGRAVTSSALGHEYEQLDVAARDWRETHAEALRLRRRLPAGAFVTVKYEEFCADPDRVVRRLVAFLGLDPAGLRPPGLAPKRHILGNSMRLRRLDSIRPDEKWRAKMSAEQVARFERIGGEMNRRFGYV